MERDNSIIPLIYKSMKKMQKAKRQKAKTKENKEMSNSQIKQK